MVKARTLLLAGLLLGAAQAQTAPEPVPPVDAPAPVSEPAPATPAPTPTPAPAATPARTAPLLVTVQVSYPALVNGQKTTVPFVSTLNLPGERVAVLRQRGTITQSLEADLKTFLASLPAQGQDARFENLGTAGWAVVQRNGLKVDVEKTHAAVLAALNDPRAVRANVVVTGQVAPKRTLDFFAGKGITALLGTGVTNYAGSSAARMTNIHVGTRNFQDRLFEGKTFSFNRFIGNISARAGYVPGLIIAGDRTETGLGGGICQVSTTAFRALYGAGLPVVERHTHSYQVHYYQPQGLDAAIYQPTLDLRFANDTGGALWFQADWNDADGHLEISVFGKARDFTVELSQPRVLKTVPSPADRLIRSAGLKPGERRQVDWAAPGATMEVTRKLVRSGKVIRQDILKSSYRPWPNIYLVGR